MDGNNGLCFVRNFFFYFRRIYVECLRDNVDENRNGIQQGNHFCRSNESKRRGDHFITLSYATSPQYKKERVRSVSYTDGMGTPMIRGNLLFELRNILSQYEMGTIKDLLNCRINLRFKNPVLPL